MPKVKGGEGGDKFGIRRMFWVWEIKEIAFLRLGEIWSYCNYGLTFAKLVNKHNKGCQLTILGAVSSASHTLRFCWAAASSPARKGGWPELDWRWGPRFRGRVSPVHVAPSANERCLWSTTCPGVKLAWYEIIAMSYRFTLRRAFREEASLSIC